MTSTPIPAGVLTVDDESYGQILRTPVWALRWADTGVVLSSVSAEQRSRLLSSPDTPACICPNEECVVHGWGDAPPVSEVRTGPLGLSEGDKVRSKTTRDNVVTFIRSETMGNYEMWLVEWDVSVRDWRYADEWEPVRDAEDAAPEPDTITVELPPANLADLVRFVERDGRSLDASVLWTLRRFQSALNDWRAHAAGLSVPSEGGER